MPITIEKMNETTFKVTVGGPDGHHDMSGNRGSRILAEAHGWHCLGGDAG